MYAYNIEIKNNPDTESGICTVCSEFRISPIVVLL